MAISVGLLLVAAATASAAVTAAPEIIVTGFEADASFKVPQALALDPARAEVIVGNTGNGTVEVFTLGGRPLARYHRRFERRDGRWEDGQPIALAVDGAGRTLVADAAAPYVDVLDGRGRSVARLELPALEGANGAGAVTALRDGSILVGTSGETGRIYRFTRDYALDGSWGETGRSPGMLTSIRGIVEAPDGTILILSPLTELAVQRFRADGTYLSGFGQHEIGDENVSFPSGIAATEDGRIFVSDELRQAVTVYDMEGTVLGRIGSGGFGPGQFQYPSALASDGRNRLAVVERIGARLQLFHVSIGSPQ